MGRLSPNPCASQHIFARQAALSKQGLPETGATLISAAIIAPNCTTAPNYTASQTGKACPKPAAHTGRPKSYYVQLGCAPRHSVSSPCTCLPQTLAEA